MAKFAQGARFAIFFSKKLQFLNRNEIFFLLLSNVKKEMPTNLIHLGFKLTPKMHQNEARLDLRRSLIFLYKIYNIT